MMFLLKDLSDGSVDAVIVSKTSTKEEIEDAIIAAKQKDGYDWNDIIEALPNDCECYDIWSSNLEKIYY